MTLPASGAISFSDIAEELRSSLPLTIPSDATRWLAEVPSGAVSLSDFHGKSAVKLVGTTEDTSEQSSTYTFSGVNFGADYPGRTIIVVVHMHSTINAILNQTGVTIGGAPGVGDDSGENTANNAAGVGIWAAQPSGTSGDVVVTYSHGGFPSNLAQGCSITVFSVAGLTSTTAHDTLGLTNGGSGDDAASGTIDIPSNGVLIMGVARSENTSAIAFTGATEVLDSLFDTDGRKAAAVANALATETGRSVGYTSSGVVASAFRAASYG